MAEFKSITTQEEFDERIKERIERAERKVREEFKGWLSPDDVKKKEGEAKEAHAAELQKLADTHAEEMKKYAGYDEKFTQQTARIHELEVNAIKTKVANEKHLPFDAVEFLSGDDEATINASADKLAKLSAANRQTGYVRNTEEATGNAVDEAYMTLARQLRGER